MKLYRLSKTAGPALVAEFGTAAQFAAYLPLFVGEIANLKLFRRYTVERGVEIIEMKRGDDDRITRYRLNHA